MGWRSRQEGVSAYQVKNLLHSIWLSKGDQDLLEKGYALMQGLEMVL